MEQIELDMKDKIIQLLKTEDDSNIILGLTLAKSLGYDLLEVYNEVFKRKIEHKVGNYKFRISAPTHHPTISFFDNTYYTIYIYYIENNKQTVLLTNMINLRECTKEDFEKQVGECTLLFIHLLL
jgi:hypothetical protein